MREDRRESSLNNFICHLRCRAWAPVVWSSRVDCLPSRGLKKWGQYPYAHLRPDRSRIPAVCPGACPRLSSLTGGKANANCLRFPVEFSIPAPPRPFPGPCCWETLNHSESKFNSHMRYRPLSSQNFGFLCPNRAMCCGRTTDVN